MFDYITEMCLSEYFLFDSVIGKFHSGERLFKRLGAIYMLPQEEIERLYLLTEHEAVKEIRTEKNYMQHLRVKQYSDMVGICSDNTEEEDEIIAVKGRALLRAVQYKLRGESDATEAEAYKALTQGANNGIIAALRMMGVLQCEGIFVKKNMRGGVKNLNKAAGWNSIEGILAALSYDESSRIKNLNRLYTVTLDTLYEPIMSAAEEKYGSVPVEIDRESTLLLKAFGNGKLRSEKFSQQHARVIFSRSLHFSDKEKILFSDNKELLSGASELPLKLTKRNIPFDGTALSLLPLQRANEQAEILQGAENCDLRTLGTYRPLCLCSDSDYVLETYAATVKKIFGGAHVERIEVADLSEHDFEPTKNNIFIHSCDEERDNVYLLFIRGDIKNTVLENVRNFLQSSKRRKFRLSYPGVVIDLSAVLPVCFCDRENARLLKKDVEMISLAPVKKEEKRGALEDLLAVKKKIYDVEDITLTEEVFEKLSALDMDEAEILLDKAIRARRKKGEILELSKETMREYWNGNAGMGGGYGFGGRLNENKQ